MSGYSLETESFKDARKMARFASARLIEAAELHGDTVLIGHGFFNILIGLELKKQGFNPLGPPQFEYGSVCEFVRG